MAAGHFHPSIWRAVGHIKMEREVAAAKIIRRDVGIEPEYKLKMEYQRMQVRLKNLCVRYREGEVNMIDFLRGVGHNIQHGQ